MQFDPRISKFVSTSAALLALVIGVGAGASATAGVQGRQDRQRERIVRGVADGSLTRGETARLVGEQARIERYERVSRRDDGHLGRRERARLNVMQDRAALRIHSKRHNEKTRRH